jgi:two-component system, sensor histidine kinase
MRTLAPPKSDADRVAELERENAKLQRINKVLMDRVERSMDFQGGAFSLFQTAIVLENKIRERTLEVERALHKLEDSNRDLARAKELAETMRTRLFEAIESVNEGFALFDSSDRLVLCNRKYLSYWPRVADRIQAGIRFSELVAMVASAGAVCDPPPDLWLRERMEHRHDMRGVFINQLADGRWIQVNERRTRDGGVVGVYTDITDIKEDEARRRESEQAEKTALMLLNDQLQQAKAQADQANLSKTRFIAAASHDLLQPLNAARLFVSALSDLELPGASGELVENVDLALASVEDLLSALLDISKLDAGAVTPEVTDFPLRGVLLPLATEYAAIAAERGIRLRVVASGAVVRSDMRLLRRIVQNFLSNALRYVQGGRVVVGCRRCADGLRIEVWDNGPGIPADKLTEIFQEFRRLDTPVTNGRDRGIGLGLAIVERVARMLDHPITVRSTVGKGAVFAVTVPRGAERRAARPLCAPAPRPLTDRLAGTSVLVLDNEPAVVAGMEALLRGWSCHVVSAMTGDQALSRLEAMERPPDLLIADYHLDNGALGVNEVTRLRAACGCRVPAILITANRTPELADEAKAADCLVLNKPVKPAQLRAVMSGLVG